MTFCKTIVFFVVMLVGHFVMSQQELRITGNFPEASVWSLLKTVSKDYGVKVAYDSREFRRITSGPFTFVDSSVDDVLDRILAPHGYRTEKVASVRVVVPIEVVPEPQKVILSEVTFSGRVVDARSGEGLPGATVRILADNRAFGTGPEGYFEIKGVPFDTSAVSVSFIGHSSKLIRPVQSPKDGVFVIRLSPNPAALPMAIVTAEPFLLLTRNEGPYVTMDGMLARSMAGTGEPDVMRAVQMNSGVSATSESGSGVEIRGSSEFLSVTVLDGFALYHTDHFFGNVGSVNPDFVRSIRLFKGPVPVTHGGTAAGLVELTGRDGNRYREQLKMGINTLSGHLTLSLPSKNNKGAFVFSGRRSFTDLLPTGIFKQMFGTTFNAGVPSVSGRSSVSGELQPEFGYHDAAFRFHFEATERKQFSFTVLTGRDRLALNYAEPLEFPGFKFSYNDESNWGNTGASFKMTDKFSLGAISEFSVFASGFNSSAKATDLRENLWFGGVDTLFSHQTNRIMDAGCRWKLYWNTSRSQWNVGAEAKSVSVRYRSFLPNNLAEEATDQNTVLSGCFGQVQFFPFEKTEFTAGVRADVLGSEKVHPAANLSFRQNIGNDYFATIEYGRQFMFVQRLTRQDISQNAPVLWQISDNQTVLATRSDQWVVGIHREKEKFNFSAEAYYRLLEDVNVHRSAFQIINQTKELPAILHGSGRAAGMDVMYSYGSAGHRAIVSASAGISLLRLPEVGADYFYADAHQFGQFKLLYGYKWKLWDFSATWVYGTGRPFTPLLGSYTIPLVNGSERIINVFGNINSGFLPAYHRADVMVSRNFDFESFSGAIGFNVYNAYNRRNVRDIRYFALGNPNNPGNYQLTSNQIGMLGRLVGIIITIEL